MIYQVYPRSFQDSNDDGIGDLRGLTQRLPYLADLGVDAVWLSPFFKSPMNDFGYDIADYRDVDPIFGTLDDFDAMVRTAHANGLKVLIDQVLSHCSSEHPWFVESRSSRENPRSDWFVWADARADGTPPNNWLSVFGGSAWQWDTRRGQYYLHNFLASQPDLNFHNSAVQEAALSNMRFWLERGVDGFRLDVINFCFHDAQLRDNPPAAQSQYNPALQSCTPYSKQQHVHDKSQPENLEFLQRLRTLMDEFPGTTTVGEISDDDTIARVAEYTSQGRLHMAYGFDLLGPRCDARFLHSVIERFEAASADAWPCWALSNHDVTRVATRWQPPIGIQPGAWLRTICMLQLCLRGSPCLYQGDELGLTEAVVPREQLRDPYGIEMWPQFTGRDGCRTPMPWIASEPHAGFTNGAPWLPVAREHLPEAALAQAATPSSLRNFYRAALAWRRRHPALVQGVIELLPAHDAVLAFVRYTPQSADGAAQAAVLCAFNLSSTVQRYQLPAGRAWLLLNGIPELPRATLEGNVLVLAPCGAAFAATSDNK